MCSSASWRSLQQGPYFVQMPLSPFDNNHGSCLCSRVSLLAPPPSCPLLKRPLKDKLLKSSLSKSPLLWSSNEQTLLGKSARGWWGVWSHPITITFAPAHVVGHSCDFAGNYSRVAETTSPASERQCFIFCICVLLLVWFVTFGWSLRTPFTLETGHLCFPAGLVA